MPKFVYRVRDAKGKSLSGVLEAGDKNTLVQSLSDRNYIVVEVKIYKKATGLFAPKVSLEALIMFSHQLSSMIGAGIPLMTCLRILWRQTEDKYLQLVTSEIGNDLEAGMSLSASMRKFPDVFPEFYTNLIEVAESGGVMPEILNKLVQYLIQRKELSVKLKKALTYPIIIIVFAVLVLVVMLVLVIPVFKKVFIKLKVDLPFLTRVILDTSDLFKKFWLLIPVLAGLAVFAYKKYNSTSRGRYQIDFFKLKIPIFGKLIFTAVLARFTHSFSLLTEGGVPIVQTIEHSKMSSDNRVVEKKLDLVKEGVVAGKGIADSLEETNFFPPFLTQMIAIGEEGGTLSEMVGVVAKDLDSQLDYQINKLVTLLEPLAIIVVGGIVLFVLLAIYLPIITLWGRIGVRG